MNRYYYHYATMSMSLCQFRTIIITGVSNSNLPKTNFILISIGLINFIRQKFIFEVSRSYTQVEYL